MAGFLSLLAGANNQVRKEQEAKRFQDVLMQQKQAAQDLQGQLTQSQIAENNAQTDAIRNPVPKAAERGRWKTEAREDGTYLVNDLTGDVKKISVPGIAKPQPAYSPKTREEYLANLREAGSINAANRTARPSNPNESETKAAGMLHRVVPAGQAVNKFDTRKTLDEIASRTGYLGNWAQTDKGRQLRNAGKIWAMSVLRPESGATISDQELDGYFETYLPRPGDDEATLAQKRQARREAEEGVAIQAGRALKPGVATSAIQADSLAGARSTRPNGQSPQVLPADLERAKHDPEFAAFLRQKER